MKKWILFFAISLIGLNGYGQNMGIKSNLLYDATTTINLGIEFALTDKFTLDISGNFNPWAFPQQKLTTTGAVVFEHDALIKHWMVQPELRWWFCEKFNGHFIGAHLHGGKMNVGGLTCLSSGLIERGVRTNRVEGWFAGAGLAYGYHLILSNRFSLEFSFGAGYIHLNYDKYVNYSSVRNPQKDINSYKMNYFGPTKAGISIIYMLY
jgi:hypothetical protein